MLSEFKEFAMKGNLVDMAVGFVLGGAFATVVTAFIVGDFITAIISFLIVAFVMFMVIKGMNKMKKAEEEAPAEPPRNEVLLEEIRNLLAKNG